MKVILDGLKLYVRYITHQCLDPSTPTFFATLFNKNSLHPPTLRYVFFEWPHTFLILCSTGASLFLKLIYYVANLCCYLYPLTVPGSKNRTTSDYKTHFSISMQLLHIGLGQIIKKIKQSCEFRKPTRHLMNRNLMANNIHENCSSFQM